MDFNEILSDIRTLAKLVKESEFHPDYLVGLARGGWIPTRLLSTELGVKELLSIGVKYEDKERTLLVTYSLPNPMPTGRSLLLVEDCLESGKSLIVARKILTDANNIVRTASIYVTDKTLELPDYYCKHLAAPPQLPWE